MTATSPSRHMWCDCCKGSDAYRTHMVVFFGFLCGKHFYEAMIAIEAERAAGTAFPYLPALAPIKPAFHHVESLTLSGDEDCFSTGCTERRSDARTGKASGKLENAKLTLERLRRTAGADLALITWLNHSRRAEHATRCASEASHQYVAVPSFRCSTRRAWRKP